MIDVRLSAPKFEANFEAVVDSIRTVGVITNVVNGVDSSVVTTENSLSVNDVIEIDDIECRVDNASATEITVNKVVSNVATSWKALFPYFMDGHFKEISQRLAERDASDDSVLKYKKYPLVVLLQDNKYDMNKVNPNFTDVSFFIVNKTSKHYITKERRVNNFNPILDPLYNELISVIRSNDYFRMTDSNFNVFRRYYWGSELADKNPFNDFLDAIEVSNLNLELITPKCI